MFTDYLGVGRSDGGKVGEGGGALSLKGQRWEIRRETILLKKKFPFRPYDHLIQRNNTICLLL